MADSLVGRLVDGRYRILSHVADGGMASVYVAMDGRLHREVALKVMRRDLAQDSAFVERFRSEARSAAGLSHPNVVAVFDQGEDVEGVFLVMELVPGNTLRQVIHDEAPLSPREALAILEHILQALQAAHHGGIIHRDVKPENVIIRPDGEVKVADFGLARAITSQAATSATGVLLGTVSYTSPEQVERGIAGPRSDMYAAGLVLFEMLTGRKAVTGETPIQIAYHHVHGSIEAPSSLVDGLPEELDDLVASSTATNPDDRYPSVDEFLRAVREVRATLSAPELDHRGQAVATMSAVPVVERTRTIDAPRTDDRGPGHHGAEPDWSRTTTVPVAMSRMDAKPPRRRRGPWAALVVAVLALVGGVGWWFTAGPGAITTVPRYVGLTLDEAATALATQSLRASSTEAFSETVPKGAVISGEPRTGAELPKQSVVDLVVSKGPERFTVPRLVGSPANAAERALGGLTLTLGKTSEDWSETVPAGVVLTQSPKEGTSVRRGTVVTLVVSKGRQPVKVPVVTGKPADVAEAELTKAGLKVKRAAEEVNHDTVPAGAVAVQTPDKGPLFRGDTVTITISKGPVMIPVPNVVDQQDAAAEKALTDLGFTVQKDYPYGPFFERKVRAQNVAPGTPAPKGTTIVLTIV